MHGHWRTVRAGEMAWRGGRDDSGARHGRGELVFANGAREAGEFVHGTKQARRAGLCGRGGREASRAREGRGGGVLRGSRTFGLSPTGPSADGSGSVGQKQVARGTGGRANDGAEQ
jgi:hypothetical protein